MIPKKHLEHRAFDQPKDEDAKVWRYMDLAKFIDMLRTKSLYFCRVDRLEDPWEANTSPGILELWREKIPKFYPMMKDSIPRVVECVRASHVCCWCMREHESDALWRIYTQGADLGVAVQTRYSTLARNLPETSYIGKVRYGDVTEKVKLTTAFDAPKLLMSKRVQYEYEAEVRIVLESDVLNGHFPEFNLKEDLDLSTVAPGIQVKVDLTSLIEDVAVSPYAGEWGVECIREVVKRFEFSFPVRESSMTVKPLVT